MHRTLDILKSNFYIAVINDKSIDDIQRLKEYELINALNKPMYAIIKEGLDWTKLKHIPWKKVYYFISEFEVPGIIQVIAFEFTRGGFHT